MACTVGNGSVACAEALLKSKRVDFAGPMSPRYPQSTCLMIAASVNSRSMLRWLLRETRGRLSVDAADEGGLTALTYAIKRDWVEGARILIKEGGADPLRRVLKVRV